MSGISRAAVILARRRRARDRQHYPLGKRTVVELRDAFRQARFVLILQCDEEGWWAEFLTFRGPARSHGCRTPIEAVDQALDLAVSYQETAEA